MVHSLPSLIRISSLKKYLFLSYIHTYHVHMQVGKPVAGVTQSEILGEMPKSNDVPCEATDFQHHHLKHLELSGFREDMHWTLIGLVKERAIHLRSIALDGGCEGSDAVPKCMFSLEGSKTRRPCCYPCHRRENLLLSSHLYRCQMGVVVRN